MRRNEVLARKRIEAVDFLKATAILAVVITHAGFEPWTSQYTAWDHALRRRWVSFHVPTFLILSGFLYFRPHAIGWYDTAARLRRVLVPYGLASLLMFLAGFSSVRGLREFGVALVSGSTLGIYYFVFALALCIAILPFLSRLSPGQVGMLLALLIGYQGVLIARPDLTWSGGIASFWRLRDPLSSFYWGYFLLGWLAAAHRERLGSLYEKHRATLLFASGIVLLAWLLSPDPLRPRYWSQGRILYTLSVLTWLGSAVRGMGTSSTVRFLSEASLPIYLYHRGFQLLLLPNLVDFHPVVRLLVLLLTGVLGSACLVAVARRTLGRQRSRFLIGA